ncbi:LuxR C-terminal-related transcriptional regulator [uncultured Neptuniibacter sp.]|uniref:LuxR C-terminal-related transcriptional regulator n=1 Tax=uncultured Neptuniibacter sp. TaxID=502143 RepID=UPI002608490D|nr:LuxR C-terminal-related transcriptional regulator [uncultured Neptuniibacter sp.]
MLDALRHRETVRNATIIGKNRLQATMLCNFLISELGIACQTTHLSKAEDITDPQLLLIDCGSYSIDQIQNLLERIDTKRNPCFVALLNSPHDTAYEALTHWPQVKGIFYEDNSTEILALGVQEIIEQGLWLPRKLTHSLLEYYRKPLTQREPSVSDQLTKKERKVLEKLAVGMSNEEIASSLNVSCHTVKSHLYKVFKKIGVSNRLQAANWAQEYL